MGVGTQHNPFERPSFSSILKPKTNAIFDRSKKLKREKKNVKKFLLKTDSKNIRPMLAIGQFI